MRKDSVQFNIDLTKMSGSKVAEIWIGSDQKVAEKYIATTEKMSQYS